MIPQLDTMLEELTETEYSNKTYKIILDQDRVSGYTEELDAVNQAVYLILSTERYAFPIYSWDYGVELVDLIGKPIPYVMSEVQRRIEDALTQDDRIEGCSDFEFDLLEKDKLIVKFTVNSIYGALSSEVEVSV